MNWASIGPFLECWLKDTLPNAQIEMPYALRLDGDMYGRTIEALDALHHKVSLDGFVIVDELRAQALRGGGRRVQRSIPDPRSAARPRRNRRVVTCGRGAGSWHVRLIPATRASRW